MTGSQALFTLRVGQLTQGDNFIPYVKTVASQVYN